MQRNDRIRMYRSASLNEIMDRDHNRTASIGNGDNRRDVRAYDVHCSTW